MVSTKRSVSFGIPVPSQKSKVKPWSGPLPKGGPPAISLSDFFRPECWTRVTRRKKKGGHILSQRSPAVAAACDIRAARSERLNALLGTDGPPESARQAGLASTGLEARGAGQVCIATGVGDVHEVASDRSPLHARSTPHLSSLPLGFAVAGRSVSRRPPCSVSPQLAPALDGTRQLVLVRRRCRPSHLRRGLRRW